MLIRKETIPSLIVLVYNKSDTVENTVGGDAHYLPDPGSPLDMGTITPILAMHYLGISLSIVPHFVALEANKWVLLSCSVPTQAEQC